MENQKGIQMRSSYFKKKTIWIAIIGLLILLLVLAGVIYTTIMFLKTKALKNEVKFKVVEPCMTTKYFEAVKVKVVEPCMTKKCFEAASTILANMDESADPCNDFYQFSCGGYERKNQVIDQISGSSFLENMHHRLMKTIAVDLAEDIKPNDLNATRNAKLLYKSCVNETNIEEKSKENILDYIKNEFNGWPLLEQENWNKKNVDINDILLKLLVKLRLHDFSPFFKITLVDGAAAKDVGNQTLLILRKPVEEVEEVEQSFASMQNVRYIKAYKEFIKNVVEEFDPSLKFVNRSQDIDDVYTLQQKLDKIILNNGTVKSTKSDKEGFINFMKYGRKAYLTLKYLRTEFNEDGMDYKTNESEKLNSTSKAKDEIEILPGLFIRTIKMLPKEWSKFNWKGFLLDDESSRLAKITEDTVVLVWNRGYLSEILDLIDHYNQTNPKALINFLIWKFVEHHFEPLPLKFHLIKYEFLKKVSFQLNKITDKKLRCATLVNERMKHVTGRLFIDNYIQKNVLEKVSNLTSYIKNSFETNLNKSDWVDNPTKFSLQKMLNGLKQVVGYEDMFIKDEIINSYYQDFQLDPNDFFSNIMKTAKAPFLRAIRTYGNESILTGILDQLTIYPGATTINALYARYVNTIILPAAILQPPVFDIDYPSYVNFGRLGTIAGHEFAHCFDYDSIQNYIRYKPIWEIKNKCINDQYDSYYISQIDKYLNGSTSLYENIADNIGIKQVFDAYQEWIKKYGDDEILPGLNYTQNQLFFISHAQLWCSKMSNNDLLRKFETSHSINQFRVLGPLSNFMEFSTTFKCENNTKYNKHKKCTFW